MKRVFCDRCQTEMAEWWVVETTHVDISNVQYEVRHQLPARELCETCYGGRPFALETTVAIVKATG